MQYLNTDFAQSTEAIEYTDECSGYDTKQAFGNVEYTLIAIAPRFTLARSGST